MTSLAHRFYRQLPQCCIDWGFATIDGLGIDIGPRHPLVMCRRAGALGHHPALSAGYSIEAYDSCMRIKDWVNTLQSSGIQVDPGQWYVDFANSARSRVYFAWCDGNVVGTAGIRAVNDVSLKAGLLTWVGVHPEHQNKRLGAGLVARAVEGASQCGMEEVFLLTNDARSSAIKTYLRAGFKACLNSWDSSHHWRWQQVERRLHISVHMCREPLHRDTVAEISEGEAVS
jgi:N-acetylglutamate synthase-like GNAT family acetyltransferase